MDAHCTAKLVLMSSRMKSEWWEKCFCLKRLFIIQIKMLIANLKCKLNFRSFFIGFWSILHFARIHHTHATDQFTSSLAQTKIIQLKYSRYFAAIAFAQNRAIMMRNWRILRFVTNKKSILDDKVKPNCFCSFCYLKIFKKFTLSMMHARNTFSIWFTCLFLCFETCNVLNCLTDFDYSRTILAKIQCELLCSMKLFV